MIPKNATGCFILYVLIGTITAIGFCQDGRISVVGVLFTCCMFGLGCGYAKSENEEVSPK